MSTDLMLSVFYEHVLCIIELAIICSLVWDEFLGK